MVNWLWKVHQQWWFLLQDYQAKPQREDVAI
jgi:hypothetical protein